MQIQRILNAAEQVLRRREVGPLLGLGILITIFGSMSENLFTRQQVAGITSLTASIGTVAIGVAFLMISGEFDLSVGAVFAICGVLFGKFLSDYGMAPWLALVLALLIAACIGLANGLVTTWFGIPSFITTLAALLVVQGVDLVISGGNTIVYFGGNKVISALGGTIPGTTIQYRVLWFVGLTMALWLVLERTAYGNWTAAVGGRGGRVGEEVRSGRHRVLDDGPPARARPRAHVLQPVRARARIDEPDRGRAPPRHDRHALGFDL